MESKWAEEHLQVIRTLMERSALYRRALAPILTYNGVLGIVGAVTGFVARIESPRNFVLFWAGIAALALSGSFFLVRRQALKESEPFWSPPTTRVAQAMLPPLVVGMILGALVWWTTGDRMHFDLGLPIVWMWLYGCALHSAGFFMQRSIKVLGWAFIASGLAVLGLCLRPSPAVSPHIWMGVSFGGLHFASGIYLYFTEKRKNAA